MPEAIADLRAAGIKVWILTGDKQETAINIGFASRQLTNSMKLLVINGSTLEVHSDPIFKLIIFSPVGMPHANSDFFGNAVQFSATSSHDFPNLFCCSIFHNCFRITSGLTKTHSMVSARNQM